MVSPRESKLSAMHKQSCLTSLPFRQCVGVDIVCLCVFVTVHRCSITAREMLDTKKKSKSVTYPLRTYLNSAYCWAPSMTAV